MGRRIKKCRFGKKNTALSVAGSVAAAALGSLTNAVLDGWHGSVELTNGRELTVKSLSADHPFFAVSVDKKRVNQDKMVTAAMIFTFFAFSVNYCFLKTLSRRTKHVNYNCKK
jgi:hypothetical protein